MLFRSWWMMSLLIIFQSVASEYKRVICGAPGWLSRLSDDLGAGHDLTVWEFEPRIGLCADSAEPAWDSLSPSLSAPPPLTWCLSQTNKQT